MGGHGGLNILPQKRWNVYNYDNREKVRKDEEDAAREEQLKREETRKRDAEYRLQQLRQARNLAPTIASTTPSTSASSPQQPRQEEEAKPSDSNHINLFEGIRIFDPVKLKDDGDEEKEKEKKKGRDFKRMRKEEAGSTNRAVGPDEEKYRLGYGVAGKGVKLPWYMEKKSDESIDNDDDDDDDERLGTGKREDDKKVKSKKSLAELREERLKREMKEKERERALLRGKAPPRERRGFSSYSGRR